MILTQTKSTVLQQAYKTSEQIMKERAVSFYQAFKQLPKTRFQGVCAVYAFCRFADDVVDMTSSAAIDDTSKTLDVLKQQLDLLYLDSSRTNDSLPKQSTILLDETSSWWPAFADTVYRFQIPVVGFLHQIEGQRWDAKFQDIQTVEQFITYCSLVAGSVGVMMLPMLADDGVDISNRALIEACESLGIAMQITNILRDVGEDLRQRNRLYLPAELLTQYGVPRLELEQLAKKTKELIISAGFIDLWEHLAQMADTYYDCINPWLAAFHPACRMPLMTAALFYRAIADAVRSKQYNCFSERCYTDDITRLRLLWEAKKRVSQL